MWLPVQVRKAAKGRAVLKEGMTGEAQTGEMTEEAAEGITVAAEEGDKKQFVVSDL